MSAADGAPAGGPAGSGHLDRLRVPEPPTRAALVSRGPQPWSVARLAWTTYAWAVAAYTAAGAVLVPVALTAYGLARAETVQERDMAVPLGLIIGILAGFAGGFAGGVVLGLVTAAGVAIAGRRLPNAVAAPLIGGATGAVTATVMGLLSRSGAADAAALLVILPGLVGGVLTGVLAYLVRDHAEEQVRRRRARQGFSPLTEDGPGAALGS